MNREYPPLTDLVKLWLGALILIWELVECHLMHPRASPDCFETAKLVKANVPRKLFDARYDYFWQIYVRVEVGRCDHRHAELLRKAKEEGATHLVLGTGGGSRLGFWWVSSKTQKKAQASSKKFWRPRNQVNDG